MAIAGPNPVDVQDFQFKLLCKLKLFNNEDSTFFKEPCNLLACASRYGLIFAGTNTNAFQVIRISSIEKYSEAGYHSRLISLPSFTKHLAVNCDGTKLAVVTTREGSPIAFFYDVTSFTKKDVNIIRQVRLSISNVNVLDICWNPTIANIFTACKDDGTLGIYELKETTIDINELPVEAQATCMSWSPKGKQIAVGSRNGKITQYKPDLKAMKVINAPPLDGNPHVIALQWISNYQFIGIFKSMDPNSGANLLVIDSPKTGDTVYTNYDDICYGYGSVRAPQFYTMYQSLWNMLLVASSNSIEVGVMGCQGEQWTQWILSDTARAELPLTALKQESLPVGMAFDISATEAVIWGENMLPPAPFLLVLSHEGLLCCFRALNIKSDAQNICQAPLQLADTTGLNEFALNTSESRNMAPKQTSFVQPIKPVVKPVESFIKQSIEADTVFKPPAPTIPITVAAPSEKAPLETLPLVMSPISNVSSMQLNESNAIQKEADMLISNLIKEECEMLQAELKALLYKASLLKVDLGTDAEAVELIQGTDTLHDFLTEVIETNTAQSTEIYILKQALIQTWAWYEDARFRLALTQDTTLEALLRLQQLDPVSQRYLVENKQISYYLDSQIKQAGQVLDDQWSDFQDKCKKIIRTKIPTMETIYQTMVRHSIVLEKQKYVLKDIANRNRALRSLLSGPSLITSLNSADLLEKSLKRLQLEPEQHFLEAQYEMVVQKQTHFTESKRDKLASLLKGREITNVKINKPQLSNVTTDLQSLLQTSPRVKKSMESLIGAGLSPITTKPTSWNSTFVQSTPKATSAVASNRDNKISTEIPRPTTSVPQSKFNFVPSQPNATSAFVPTIQLGSCFNTNKNVTTSVSNSSGFPLLGGTTPFSTGTSAELSSSAGFSSPTEKKMPLFSGSFTTTTSSTFVIASQSMFSSPVSNTVGSTFTSKTITTPDTAAVNTSVFSFAPSVSSAFSISSPIITSKTSVSSSFSFSSPTMSGNQNLFSKSNVSTPFGFSFTTTTVTTALTITTNTSGNSNKHTTVVSASSMFTKSEPSVGTTAQSPFKEIPTEGLSIQSASSQLSPSLKSTLISKIGIATSEPASLSLLDKSISLTVNPVSVTAIPTKPLFDAEGTTTTTPVSSFFSPTKSSSIFSSLSTTSVTTTSAATLSNITSTIISDKPESKPLFGLTNIATTGSIFSSNSETKISAVSSTPTNIFSSTLATKTTTADAISQSVFSTSNSTPVTSSISSETKFVFGSASTQTKISEASPSVSVTQPENKTQDLFKTSSAALGPFFSTTTTGQSIFASSPVTIPVTSPTASTAITTTQSLFAPSKSAFTFSATTTTGFSFGTGSTTNTSLFGSVTTTASGSIFGTPTTTTSLFSSPISSPISSSSAFPAPQSGSIFSSQSGSIFSSTASSTPSIFGATTNTTPVFGSGAFTNKVATATPFSATTATPFATTTAPFAATTATPFAATTATPFAATTATPFAATTATPFAATTATPFAATTASPFAATTPTPFSATTASPFAATSPGGVFGQQPTFGSGSIFGSPVTTSSAAFGTNSSVFGSAQSPTETGFSKSFSFTLPPSSTSSNSFGFDDLNMGSNASTFGGQAANPFAKSFAPEQKSFGGGSLFGTPTTTSASIFGNNSSSSFGFGSGASGGFGASSGFGTSVFGQQSTFSPQQQQSPFGGQSQPGAFTGGNQAVSQTGFGGLAQQTQKTGFGAAPVFGSSPGAFGTAPSFGSPTFNSSFGSPNKIFGGSSNEPTASFGSSPQQQNPTFANLATQNTIGFGALAQQSPQSQPNNQSGYSGGSSFSTWR